MGVYFFYETAEPVPFRYLTPTLQVGPLPPPYESDMSPSDYLEFAVEDLASDTARGLINSFSNAKRAFHLAIDSLLHQYGLFAKHRKSRFPEKLRLIDAIGMIPIEIMRNLNVERNLLEHEYAVPSKTRVKEAIDVTRLLLLATERLVEATPHEAVIGWRKPARHLLMQLEPQAGELRFFRISGQCRKLNGVSCISGPIRPFGGHGFSNGIKVAEKPWKTVPLDKAHLAEWQPIVRELVRAQRRQASRSTFVDHEHLTMTMSITLPFSLPEGTSWHEVLDKAIKEYNSSAASGDSSEHKDLDDSASSSSGAATQHDDTDGPSS